MKLLLAVLLLTSAHGVLDLWGHTDYLPRLAGVVLAGAGGFLFARRDA